jgi:hypothetical protein
MPFLSFITEEMNPTTIESLATIFRFGKMCIWADLSLRWSGYGDIIDFSLPVLLSQLREEIDEELERELSAASPEIAVAMETCFEKLMAVPALPGDMAGHPSR